MNKGDWKVDKRTTFSVTNEVRGGVKGSVGIVSGMPILWNHFLIMKKFPKQTNILHIDTLSLNEANPFNRL